MPEEVSSRGSHCCLFGRMDGGREELPNANVHIWSISKCTVNRRMEETLNSVESTPVCTTYDAFGGTFVLHIIHFEPFNVCTLKICHMCHLCHVMCVTYVTCQMLGKVGKWDIPEKSIKNVGQRR